MIGHGPVILFQYTAILELVAVRCADSSPPRRKTLAEFVLERFLAQSKSPHSRGNCRPALWLWGASRTALVHLPRNHRSYLMVRQRLKFGHPGTGPPRFAKQEGSNPAIEETNRLLPL